jgi:antitoxin MazE
MVTKVQKWGNSLGLRIPKSFAAEASLSSGAEVDLTVRDGRLIVTPIKRRKYKLEELVSRITPKNVHPSAWPEDVRGREAPL